MIQIRIPDLKFLLLFLTYVDNTRIHSTSAKFDFWLQGTSKRVNPLKSLLRKFDSKTILSLLIGKRK